MAVARVDAGGRLTDRHTAPTPARGTAEGMWDVLAGLVAAARHGDEVAVGVGCGGPMLPGGEAVSPLNIPAWRGFPLRSRLAELCGLDRKGGVYGRGGGAEGW